MSYSAQAMRDRVLYEDDRVIILDKPAGILVHSVGDMSEDLEKFLPLIVPTGDEAPRLAHRLDRDTAGCLLLARDAATAAQLGFMFVDGRVEKTYWAIVQGRPKTMTGTIDLPLGKVWVPGGSKMVLDVAGKPALSRWRLLAGNKAMSLVALYPRTGRTHQLRAHCAYMAMPILGDRTYGAERPPSAPLHLLARALRLPGLVGPAPMIEAIAPLPPHMRETLMMMQQSGDWWVDPTVSNVLDA